MEQQQWFAVCVFNGSKVDLLAQKIDIKESILQKIEAYDPEILEGIYDCYCNWVTENNITDTVFATVFRTNLRRLDSVVILNRLILLEDTISFMESGENVAVWVGLKVDEYLYGMLNKQIHTT